MQKSLMAGNNADYDIASARKTMASAGTQSGLKDVPSRAIATRGYSMDK
jgi:hypothetical protein